MSEGAFTPPREDTGFLPARSRRIGEGRRALGSHLRPLPRPGRTYRKAAACMRWHDFPDSSVEINIPSRIDQNSSRFTSAATICTKLIPAGRPGTHAGNS
jgi:hypothetical protein